MPNISSIREISRSIMRPGFPALVCQAREHEAHTKKYFLIDKIKTLFQSDTPLSEFGIFK